MLDLNAIVKCSRKEIVELIRSDELKICSIDSRSPTFNAFVDLLNEYGIFEEFWDYYLDRAIQMEDSTITWLIANNISIEHLAHLDLDDRWLFELMGNNVEAMQTLIVRHYTNGTPYYHSNHSSVCQFINCMGKIILSEARQYLLNSEIQDWICKLKSDNEAKSVIMKRLFESGFKLDSL